MINAEYHNIRRLFATGKVAFESNVFKIKEVGYVQQKISLLKEYPEPNRMLVPQGQKSEYSTAVELDSFDDILDVLFPQYKMKLPFFGITHFSIKERQVGIFPQSCTFEALEQICGITREEIEKMIARAAIERRFNRYYITQNCFLYLEILEKTIHKFIRFYTEKCKSYFQQNIDSDRLNIEKAYQYAFKVSDWESSYVLLTTLSRIYDHLGLT